ncbi:MAG: ACT domain-containing protein [Stomatobaculum sp.]
MGKVIITVLGKDTVGIIARVCTYLAASGINILDINQTIVQDYFHMMMIADMSRAEKSLETVMSDLDGLGEEIGVRIRVQREEIFTGMHRI